VLRNLRRRYILVAGTEPGGRASSGHFEVDYDAYARLIVKDLLFKEET
jgi:hypothetical protein